MATCNPSTLLESAKCFSCLSKKELQAVIAQLICNIGAAGTVQDHGVATLAAGQVTVASTVVTSTSTILVSYYWASGAVGILYYWNVVDGVSFDIGSSAGGDTNKVSWAVIN